MPDFIGYLLKGALWGVAIGLFATVTIIGLDVAGLRSLLTTADVKWMAAGLFSLFICLTFGSVTMGIAIMRVGSIDRPNDFDEPGQGLRISPPQKSGVLRPVRVRRQN